MFDGSCQAARILRLLTSLLLWFPMRASIPLNDKTLSSWCGVFCLHRLDLYHGLTKAACLPRKYEVCYFHSVMILWKFDTSPCFHPLQQVVKALPVALAQHPTIQAVKEDR
jgi:hypothetical protein